MRPRPGSDLVKGKQTVMAKQFEALRRYSGSVASGGNLVNGVLRGQRIVHAVRPKDQVRAACNLYREKRVQGSRMGSGNFRLDIPLYCDMYLRGQLMLDELISEVIDLSEVNRGLAELDGSDGARSVIRFD